MKHIGKYLSLLVCIITAVGTLIACGPAGCSSTGYSGDGWYRPDFGKEMEARDDAKGREHIEIPNDATTIVIGEEEYNVVRNCDDFDREKNNILANDISINYYYCLGKHKFNGNNYKFYGDYSGSPILNSVENSTIENVVFSSNIISGHNNFKGLIDTAKNTIIRNCVNYFSTASLPQSYAQGGTIIFEAYNCTIENVINYGDMRFGSGICDNAFEGTVIKDCVNYGNLSYSKDQWYDDDSHDYPIGGIVGRIRGDVQIKNCINYGNIIGKIFCGGIVGFNANEANWIYEAISYKATENYTDGQIIENCENYGNIYLKLASGANEISYAQNPSCSRYYKEFEKLKWNDRVGIWYDAGANVTGIGGIAGFASKIRNCKNHGAFYGFNKLEDDLYVDYCGGIAGIAREITDCETDYTIDNIQKGRALNVGNLAGYILDENN